MPMDRPAFVQLRLFIRAWLFSHSEVRTTTKLRMVRHRFQHHNKVCLYRPTLVPWGQLWIHVVVYYR